MTALYLRLQHDRNSGIPTLTRKNKNGRENYHVHTDTESLDTRQVINNHSTNRTKYFRYPVDSTTMRFCVINVYGADVEQ